MILCRWAERSTFFSWWEDVMADNEKSTAEAIRHKWEHGDKTCVNFLLVLKHKDSIEDAIREETLEKLFEEDHRG